jgi:UDP-3-O-[3-hydroxymyristoyl] glucosamine N-acyltransferase
MAREITIKELIDSIQEQYRVLGSMDTHVRSPSPIDQADDNSLCYCKKKGEQALEMIRNSRAKVIICSDSLDLTEADYQGKTLIQVSNPRLTFSRLLHKYFTPIPEFGIHPTAVISEKTSIGREVYIGPYSYIGDCEIGNGTRIDGHVYIHDGTRIGKGVIIHAGVVIGAEAVGFERNEIGEWVKFPQISGVVIEDNVEVGANSVVCRGSLSDTLVGKGTKVDNLVRIGHGVRIGKHCIIIAGAIICGSVKIGDYTWIGPLACIRENIRIGNQVLVGAGSVVHKDIDDNLVVTGSPARPIRKNTTFVK